MIEISDLTKVYNTNGSLVEALRGVNLTIPQSTTLVIEGVSGSGKSTLLHIIGSLDHPTDGIVKYNGENIFDKNEEEIAEFRNNKVGFVFQFHYLLNEFDALENVMMPALIKGSSRKDAALMATEMLEKVGLSQRINHRPGELSGGEQQRVAIARSILLKPSVVLADEPTGNLDQKTGSAIIDLFFRLNQDFNTTIIIVTHNTFVSSLFQKKIKLLDGQIINEQ